MNMNEINALTALVRQACPAQKITDETEEAWLLFLRDVEFRDALEGLKTVIHSGARFVEVGPLYAAAVEIAARRRAARLEATPLPRPSADPDDVGAYLAELRRAIDAVAAGATVPSIGERAALAAAAANPAPSDALYAARAAAEGHSEDFLRTRAAANRVPCRWCGMPVGQACVVDGGPLHNAAAHQERLEDAGLAEPRRYPTDDEIRALLASRARPLAS